MKNNQNNLIHKALNILVMFVVTGLICITVLSLFSEKESKINTNEYRTKRSPLTKRFPKLGKFEKCYWKADIIGKNSRLSVPGPTSYWMKGFVFLNKKDLEMFKNQYEWTPTDHNWKPSLDTNILDLKSLKWAYSHQFDSSIRKSSSYYDDVDYVRFYLDIENGIIYFHVEE